MKLGQQSQQGWALEKNTPKLATEKGNTRWCPLRVKLKEWDMEEVIYNVRNSQLQTQTKSSEK